MVVKILLVSKGLKQHQQQNRSCLNKMRDIFSTDSSYFTAKETLECLPVLTINRNQTLEAAGGSLLARSEI